MSRLSSCKVMISAVRTQRHTPGTAAGCGTALHRDSAQTQQRSFLDKKLYGIQANANVGCKVTSQWEGLRWVIKILIYTHRGSSDNGG